MPVLMVAAFGLYLGWFCGDGTLDGAEECDLGTTNNTGAYGGCNTDCTLAGFCGDGVVEEPEECDLGIAGNTGAYEGCNEDCSLAAYCGDGEVNGDEECDDGDLDDTMVPARHSV